MFKNPLLLIALTLTGLIATWGIIDTVGLTKFSSAITGAMFTSRGWFVMLSASLLLILCIWLAISPYGKIKLGKDHDEPEFSTVSWLSMLFAAGMGVGLLFWGTAEPLSHFKVVRNYTNNFQAAGHSLFVTIFHWGLHAWAIYAVTGLVMAYFSFRKGYPNLVSAPMKAVFGQRIWTKSVGWLSDLLAIYAIAIGIGGSIAMGVVYANLDRLVRKGYLQPYLGEPTAVRGGMRKKYFKVTQDGLKALIASKAVHDRIWDGYSDMILTEGV